MENYILNNIEQFFSEDSEGSFITNHMVNSFFSYWERLYYVTYYAVDDTSTLKKSVVSKKENKREE
jgi:hypothetical protein